MPKQNGHLGKQERAFAAAYAETGNTQFSSMQAKYAHGSVSGSRTLARPAVQAEIARIQTERLFNEVLPAAINCLREIIINPKAPAGARVQAAKVVMDRTLGQDDAQQGKEPHEMTGEELARAIAELEAVAAGRARVVNPEPAEIGPEIGDVFE